MDPALKWAFVRTSCGTFMIVVICIVAVFAWPTHNEACPSILSPFDIKLLWSTYFLVLALVRLVHFVIEAVYFLAQWKGEVA
mmetsp:Transcript_78409/g.203783  ORF Transcript_78409/g.203783 Transcript_78409/m.203783 type:complete len:82 (-) Transcript_78409:241-486(-)